MAGELPYFKFNPGKWLTGNIQMCSYEAQGIYINLCSLYWQRQGELPYTLALHLHCKQNDDALQELINKEIVVITDGQIIIQFLDEQLNEFMEVSEKRAVAAKKRWDAKAMQLQCKSNAIREEKIREDKNKEDIYSFSEFWDSYHEITGLKKTDMQPAQKYWKQLTKGEKEKALKNIQPYYDSLNDKKYCKKARTYLSAKSYNDEFKINNNGRKGATLEDIEAFRRNLSIQ